MRASLVLALGLSAAAGCTVDRELPASAFACSAGGPCLAADATPDVPRDARPPGEDAEAPADDAAPGLDVVLPSDADAEIARPDAGLPDADAPDAAAPDAVAPDAGPPDSGADAGEPVQNCRPATPLPQTGIATGDTSGAMSTRDGFCATEQGANDVSWFFTVTGSISALVATTEGSSFDTVLYAYRNSCRAGEEFECSDDTGNGSDSRLDLAALGPGTYYLVVDGFGRADNGSYVLNVAGELAAGSVCDPNQQFLACARGVCLPAAGGARCQDGRDCMDGFDTDGDGAIDEDACNRPPVASCPAGASVSGLFGTPVMAMATDDGQIIAHRWTVTSMHHVPPRLIGARSGTVEVRPVIAGTYRLRYEATDDLAQTHACETTLAFTPDDLLHVELTWVGTPTADLDLHLLEPSAPAWFDELLDCEPFGCAQGLEWGGPGAADNPRHREATERVPGGERIEILTPQPGTYRVGAHYTMGPGGSGVSARIRIYCGGVLIREMTANMREGGSAAFWKAADITVTGGSCTVNALMAQGGGPLLVDVFDAETIR